MDITLSKCPDITCMDKNHVYCPQCYNIIHINSSVKIIVCNDLTCTRNDHYYCPRCYYLLHVSKNI